MLINRIIEPQAAITSSSELAKILQAGFETNSGVTVTSDTALRSSVVWACVMLISESLAQLPFILYQRDGKDKNRAITNSLYYLLHDQPNDFQTSYDWRLTKTLHILLRGVGYSFINRSPSTGEILELLPMHPDSVKMFQEKDHSIHYELRGEDGQVTPLKQDQVYRIIGPSLDGITGLSPISYHRETIGISIAADQHSARAMKSGGRFDGILTHPSTFKDDKAAERVRESWQAQATGANLYKTPFLEDGMTWQAVTMSNRDAQYVETRKFTTEDIARIFRCQPHKVGHLEKATNNNIEHQGLEFVIYTMAAWFKRWEQSAYRDLFTPAEKRKLFVEFLADGLMRGDSAARSEYYTKMVAIKAMNPNEVRARENMNSYPKGDVFENPNTSTNTGGDTDDESDDNV